MNTHLTVIILAHNEEVMIENALKSVDWADEVIVLNDGSTDRTVERAKKLGALVVARRVNGDFAAARNYAMSRANNNLIMFLDADERVSSHLKKSIIAELKNPQHNSYRIRRRDHMWGQIVTRGEVRRAATHGLIRLMHKDHGMWEGQVHEVYDAQGSVGSLEGFIEHYPHQSLAEFIASVNMYSTIRARQLEAAGDRGAALRIIIYPPMKFLYTYIVLGGFMDGPAGFLYSFMMSFHSFLVGSKLYQYTRLKS